MSHSRVRPGPAGRALLVLSALAAACTPPPGDAPATAARAFYAALIARAPAGIPDADGRAALRPLLSARLDRLLQAAADAEARWARRTERAEPPLLEGALFTSLFEGADSLVALAPAPGAEPAVYEATLRRRDAIGGGPPTEWRDRVRLVREGGRWVVDDVELGGTWAFAARGRVTARLQDVVARAAEGDTAR